LSIEEKWVGRVIWDFEVHVIMEWHVDIGLMKEYNKQFKTW